MMKSISLEDVLLFHKKIIAHTGGAPGIRDIALVDSALNRAFVTFDGNELFPETIVKIAANVII